MREPRIAQAIIFDDYAKHEIGNQMAMMSKFLDNCGELISWVEADLSGEDTQHTGRTSLLVESVLRCAILKRVRVMSYKELAFYLEDGGSFQSSAPAQGSGAGEIGPAGQHPSHKTPDLGTR